jgi:hypothetical protein
MPVFILLEMLEFSSMLWEVKKTLTISSQSGRREEDEVGEALSNRYQ